jgi:hypothetical protein
MDPRRGIEALRRQIDEAQSGRPADHKGWKERTQATVRAVMGGDHPAVKALIDVRYGLMIATSSTPQSDWDRARESGVRSAVAILEGAIHELELRAEVGPELQPGSLHPWIAGAVAGLWDSGHHRQAVDEATRAIEVRLKAMTGSHQTGTPLVTDAFNPAPPKAGEKRLRFPQFEVGTPSWTNAHEGAMAFARGCMMRIRNLIEHDDGWDEREALESLAALSLLARWTESATVIEGN